MDKGMSKFERYLRQVQEDLGRSESNSTLRESMDKFPLLPNQCLYIYDFKRADVVYSRNAEALGLPPDGLTKERILAIHPDDQKLVLEIAKIGIEAGIRGYSTPGEYSLNITYRLKMPDNTYIKVFRQSRVLEIDDKERMSTNLSLLTRIDFLDTGHKVKWSFSPPLIDDSAVHRLVKERLNGLFSRREVEVIKAIAKGRSSMELAEEWHLSKHTIDTHRRNILRKAGAKNSIELIEFAREIGIVE